MPSLNTLIEGRGGNKPLPGPLCQLGLGRDGTYFVIAAGRANHAGQGVWKGVASGNTNFIGIKAENTGDANDRPWPDVQMDAYHSVVAAILKHVGRGADFCAGHKEYATPLGRKNDLEVNADGNFGANTEAAVRVFQRAQGLVPDGIVGPKTWAALDTV
jgi:peptidoglycan hydrolase-like protein with peptidoglycan-binding domain